VALLFHQPKFGTAAEAAIRISFQAFPVAVILAQMGASTDHPGRLV
jgi:hypothetical protein